MLRCTLLQACRVQDLESLGVAFKTQSTCQAMATRLGLSHNCMPAECAATGYH